jgi:nicotinate dehydrogenase large molybdopterin subunit
VNSPAEPEVVGRSVPREDAIAKVTGRARYAADLEFPRMLHAKAVRVPIAHGRIKGIDCKDAYKMPGVVAVLTPDDIPGRDGDETWVQVLAQERIRSFADAVAVIAAETEPAAMEAVRCVRIDYEEFPAL